MPPPPLTETAPPRMVMLSFALPMVSDSGRMSAAALMVTGPEVCCVPSIAIRLLPLPSIARAAIRPSVRLVAPLPSRRPSTSEILRKAASISVMPLEKARTSWPVPPFTRWKVASPIERMSLPWPPISTSTPPLPSKVSLSRPPTMWSAAAVPTKIPAPAPPRWVTWLVEPPTVAEPNST